MEVALIRKSHFNAAHRLYVEEWSKEKNLDFFGKCSNPYFHGHNYEIEVMVIGVPDPVTGMLMDLTKLKDIIHKEVEERYDHKNLNEELPEFKLNNPTVENIAIEIYNRLKPKLNPKHDLQIKLYETPRNMAIYPARI